MLFRSLSTQLTGLQGRIRELEGQAGQVGGLHGRIRELEGQAGQVGGLQGRIRELEAAATAAAARPSGPRLDLAAGTRVIGSTVKQDDLELVEGIGPKIAELLRAQGINTWAELAATDTTRLRSILDAGGPNYRIADPASWPHQGALLAYGHWGEFKTLTDDLTAGRYGSGRDAAPAARPASAAAGAPAAPAAQRVAATPAAVVAGPDVKAGGAALGIKLKLDDLKVVEGIGPKIEELCQNIGIRTWRALSQADVATLRKMLDDAGPRFQMHDPATWPRQAGLLADAKWDDFKALTENLKGGRVVD